MFLNCHIFVILIMAVVIVIMMTQIGGYKMTGGDLSPRMGPVDMLQERKQLLMDGYRFQNSLFPPVEHNRDMVTDCNPIDRQRVGIFKDKAYIDQEGGHEGASQATLAQLNGRGDQDRYITGEKGVPIEDSVNPFGGYVHYNRPEEKLEVNYPNEVFSWGDVMYRYGPTIYL